MKTIRRMFATELGPVRIANPGTGSRKVRALVTPRNRLYVFTRD
jgi:hypothetical protein